MKLKWNLNNSTYGTICGWHFISNIVRTIFVYLDKYGARHGITLHVIYIYIYIAFSMAQDHMPGAHLEKIGQCLTRPDCFPTFAWF